MNKTFLFSGFVLLASASAMAGMQSWDYRIKLTKNTGDLDIEAHTFVGPAVVVGLQNSSDKRAFCTASFVGYPHAPGKDEFASATIPAGRHATLSYPVDKLGGNISTAFVDLKCSDKS